MQLYVNMKAPNPSTNVKQLRESRKLTLRKVATALDVAESTVSRWEAGSVRPHLPLDKVDIMLDLFDCDFKTLFNAFQQTWQEKEECPKSTDTAEKIPAAV
jgi:transcriptional regulator with XRE-family HTH domain